MKNINILLSEKAKAMFDLIQKDAPSSKQKRSLASSIGHKFEILRNNFQYGDPLSKTLIPTVYIEEHGITNLYRLELSGFWRMLYTVKNGPTENEITVFIIDILDHERYDKLFKYRKK